MDGNLDEIIDALATHEQAEKLRQLNAQTDEAMMKRITCLC